MEKPSTKLPNAAQGRISEGGYSVMLVTALVALALGLNWLLDAITQYLL